MSKKAAVFSYDLQLPRSSSKLKKRVQFYPDGEWEENGAEKQSLKVNVQSGHQLPVTQVTCFFIHWWGLLSVSMLSKMMRDCPREEPLQESYRIALFATTCVFTLLLCIWPETYTLLQPWLGQGRETRCNTCSALSSRRFTHTRSSLIATVRDAVLSFAAQSHAIPAVAASAAAAAAAAAKLFAAHDCQVVTHAKPALATCICFACRLRLPRCWSSSSKESSIKSKAWRGQRGAASQSSGSDPAKWRPMLR